MVMADLRVDFGDLISWRRAECVDNLPEIALVGGVLDVIADGLEHPAGRGYRPTVKQLLAPEW